VQADGECAGQAVPEVEGEGADGGVRGGGHVQQRLPRARPRSGGWDGFTEGRWTGAFDGMMGGRQVRVLAPYSRPFFYNELGRERGYAADLVRVFEKYINQKFAAKLGKRPITVLMIPMTRGFGVTRAGRTRTVWASASKLFL